MPIRWKRGQPWLTFYVPSWLVIVGYFCLSSPSISMSQHWQWLAHDYNKFVSIPQYQPRYHHRWPCWIRYLGRPWFCRPSWAGLRPNSLAWGSLQLHLIGWYWVQGMVIAKHQWWLRSHSKCHLTLFDLTCEHTDISHSWTIFTHDVTTPNH